MHKSSCLVGIWEGGRMFLRGGCVRGSCLRLLLVLLLLGLILLLHASLRAAVVAATAAAALAKQVPPNGYDVCSKGLEDSTQNMR